MKKLLSPATMHQRTVSADAALFEGRTVELSFSSEAHIRQFDWRRGEYYDEILSHNEASVNLTRLQELGGVYFNHNRYSLPIGRIERAWIDSSTRRGRARIVFDDDPDSERVFQKVKSGSLRGVSVGYTVTEWEEIQRNETKDGITGPAMIARNWEPMEISIVTIPADPSVGVGRSFTEDNIMENDMTLNTGASQVQEPTPAARAQEPEPQNPAAAPANTAAQSADNSAAAVGLERQRAADITDLCRAFDMDPDQYIRSGASLADVNAAIVAQQRAQRQPLPTAQSRQAARINVDEADKFRAAAADGLRLRLGASIEKPADGAQEFRGAHLIDLARSTLERQGERLNYGISHMELASRAMATSDFPLILGNVANATLRESYNAAPSTWQAWCGVGSLSDFKEQSIVKLSETGDLELIPEGGEYKFSDFTETKDSIRLYTYGKKFALTRQAIVNDDLRAFTRLPSRFGTAAARTINRAVYTLLTSASTKISETGKTLFHADHHNLASPGSLFSSNALSAARTAMRRQKGLKGEDSLNIAPTYVIVPPELETLVEKLLTSDTDLNATAAGIRNVFKNSLTMITEAELSDVKAWYLAASASLIDTIEVAFLDGVQAPLIEQRPGWDVDGFEWKIRLDFGVKCWDYRGLYKNPGANAE